MEAYLYILESVSRRVMLLCMAGDAMMSLDACMSRIRLRARPGQARSDGTVVGLAMRRIQLTMHPAILPDAADTRDRQVISLPTLSRRLRQRHLNVILLRTGACVHPKITTVDRDCFPVGHFR